MRGRVLVCLLPRVPAADTPSRLADSLDGVTTLYENFQ